MRKPYRLLGLGLLAGLSLLAGCGGGGGEKSSTPTRVGSATCTNTCHALSKDITGTQIAVAWANTTHTTDGDVQCEDCHGAGSLHMGVGDIAYPNPQAAQCEVCHTDKRGFDSTRHANSNPFNGTNLTSFTGPDKFFFQGDALNSGTAEIMGKPEFLPDGVTPVTHAQHIEECSRCHNPNQRFEYSFADGSGPLIVPDPNNMPDPPNITCAGCHDAHQPEAKVKIAQRKDPAAYPVFRKYFVNPTGEQNDNVPGTQFAASIYQPNGAVQPDGTVDYTKVVGRNNEISPERLCASCHTKGKYKYSQLATHQNNVYAQWLKSGHADRSGAPFAEFSANPSAYTNEATGHPYEVGTHRGTWPFDMSLITAGTTASTSQNGGYIPEGSTTVANAYQCYKCHNGIGSIAWQDNVQGTPKAPVIFGDVTVTCITCHDPHRDVEGQSKNTRRPAMMTNYSNYGVTIQGNFFLDKQPVPLEKTGNATICIFCHQGRESGLTLYKARLAPGATITGNFFNPHYLGTAAMLWGANAYEYPEKLYGVNVFHQTTGDANCTGCHMGEVSSDGLNGGHTWTPNVASCNISNCHATIGKVAAKPGTSSPDVEHYRSTSDTRNYTGDPGGASLSIAESIRVLQQKVIAQLNAQGVYYDDLNYPYFFKTADPATHTSAGNPGGVNNFTAWTPRLLKAAFNLSFAVKGLPAGATSQANVPNASAAVHNYLYTIQLLLDSYENLTGSPIAGATRPTGTRPATLYGPGQ
jgi:hypothetical protein